jgi:hypothetical protein
MTDGHVTLSDVVNAASDTLAAVEAGTMRPSEVETRAVAECRRLFGVVGVGHRHGARTDRDHHT